MLNCSIPSTYWYQFVLYICSPANPRVPTCAYWMQSQMIEHWAFSEKYMPNEVKNENLCSLFLLLKQVVNLTVLLLRRLPYWILVVTLLSGVCGECPIFCPITCCPATAKSLDLKMWSMLSNPQRGDTHGGRWRKLGVPNDFEKTENSLVVIVWICLNACAVTYPACKILNNL